MLTLIDIILGGDTAFRHDVQSCVHLIKIRESCNDQTTLVAATSHRVEPGESSFGYDAFKGEAGKMTLTLCLTIHTGKCRVNLCHPVESPRDMLWDSIRG